MCPYFMYHTLYIHPRNNIHTFTEHVNSEMVFKVRVEVTDEEGVKTSIEREGDLMSEGFKSATIKSIMRFLEENIPSPSIDPYDIESEDLTIKDRLESFLRYDSKAPKDWFTSSELKRIYEEVYGVSIRLSTLSTYLASMHSEGILIRKGSRAQRKYKVVATKRVEQEHEDSLEMIECIPLREIIR